MDKDTSELASRISYEIVEDVAPKELVLFDAFKEEFLGNPDAFLEKDQQKREKMLGFSVPAGTDKFLTTIVLPVVFEVVKRVGKELSTKLKREPSKDKLEKLREDAYNNAIALGMDKEKAELMADALLGKLVRLSQAK